MGIIIINIDNQNTDTEGMQSKNTGTITKGGGILPSLETIKTMRERGYADKFKIKENSRGLLPYYGGKYKQSKTILNEILDMQLVNPKKKFVSGFHGGMSVELGISKYKDSLGFETLIANEGDKSTHAIAFAIKNKRESFVEAVTARMNSCKDDNMSKKYTTVLKDAANYVKDNREKDWKDIDIVELGAAGFICTSLSRDNMTTAKAAFNEKNKMCLDRLDTIQKKIDDNFSREYELLQPYELKNELYKNRGLYDIIKRATGHELFFLDPPYTKGFEGYAMALNQDNFMKNMKKLVEKGCSIMICGYDNKLYENELVKKMDFTKVPLCKLQNSYGNMNDEYIWLSQNPSFPRKI